MLLLVVRGAIYCILENFSVSTTFFGLKCQHPLVTPDVASNNALRIDHQISEEKKERLKTIVKQDYLERPQRVSC